MDIYEKLLNEKSLDELLEEARIWESVESKTKDSDRKLIIPEFKDAMFLEGAFGREINEKVQGKYGRYEAISKVVFEDNIVKGSTLFYCVAVQEFLPENVRVAAQADLEKILKSNTLPLQGQYEDSSLVWRSNQEPNEYLAKDINKQFKAKGIELEEGKAYVIPLFTLKLREDSKSPYKLAFDITELTLQNYFEAPILMCKNGYFSNEDIDEKIGLTVRVREKTKNRKRYLCNINSGICRLYLNWCLDSDSYERNFDFSDVYGRVVCIRAEGTTPKNLGGK